MERNTKKIIDNCGKNYRKRLEKVIELEGERLEPSNLIKKKKILKKILKRKRRKNR
jgi:hypothetical protein